MSSFPTSHFGILILKGAEASALCLLVVLTFREWIKHQSNFHFSTWRARIVLVNLFLVGALGVVWLLLFAAESSSPLAPPFSPVVIRLTQTVLVLAFVCFSLGWFGRGRLRILSLATAVAFLFVLFVDALAV